MAAHINIFTKNQLNPKNVYFLFVAVPAFALPDTFVATASTGFSGFEGSFSVIFSAAATSPTCPNSFTLWQI